jgi:hypothetical protein
MEAAAEEPWRADGVRVFADSVHHFNSSSSSGSSVSISSSTLSWTSSGTCTFHLHPAPLELDVVVAREHVGDGVQTLSDLLALRV